MELNKMTEIIQEVIVDSSESSSNKCESSVISSSPPAPTYHLSPRSRTRSYLHSLKNSAFQLTSTSKPSSAVPFEQKYTHLKKIHLNLKSQKRTKIANLKAKIHCLEAENRNYQKDVKKLQKDNLELRIKNMKIKEESGELEVFQEKLDRTSTSLVKRIDELMLVKKDLEGIAKKAKELEKDNKINKILIKNLRDKDFRETQNYFKSFRTAIARPDGTYKQLLGYFIEKVESLFECPLSFEKMELPVVLPSGISIHQDFFDVLTKRESNDPYDRTKEIKGKIHNRLFTYLKDMIDEIKKLKKSLEYEKYHIPVPAAKEQIDDQEMK